MRARWRASRSRSSSALILKSRAIAGGACVHLAPMRVAPTRGVSKDGGGRSDLGFTRDRQLECASRESPACEVGDALLRNAPHHEAGRELHNAFAPAARPIELRPFQPWCVVARRMTPAANPPYALIRPTR
jgi:hypothetical protein